MKVKELIALLQAQDPEAAVGLVDRERDSETAGEPFYGLVPGKADDGSAVVLIVCDDRFDVETDEEDDWQD